MSLFKNLTTAVFLGTATVAAAVAIPQPTYAATAASVANVIDARIAQLNADRAAFEAILADPNSSTTEKSQAQRDRQIVLFRIVQATAIKGMLGNFSPAILASLENFFQAQVSAA